MTGIEVVDINDDNNSKEELVKVKINEDIKPDVK